MYFIILTRITGDNIIAFIGTNEGENFGDSLASKAALLQVSNVM
jgi:hypothetical protein